MRQPTAAHIAGLMTIEELHAQGRISRNDLIVLQRAFETDPFEEVEPPRGTVVFVDDPAPDWSRPCVVLGVLAALFVLSLAALAFISFHGARP